MPMTSTRNIPDKASSSYSHFVRQAKHVLPDKGYFVLAFTLILLAALASFDFSPAPPMVVENEIASQDIYADRSFLFEDAIATAKKKEQAGLLQPLRRINSARGGKRLRRGGRGLISGSCCWAIKKLRP